MATGARVDPFNADGQRRAAAGSSKSSATNSNGTHYMYAAAVAGRCACSGSNAAAQQNNTTTNNIASNEFCSRSTGFRSSFEDELELLEEEAQVCSDQEEPGANESSHDCEMKLANSADIENNLNQVSAIDAQLAQDTSRVSRTRTNNLEHLHLLLKSASCSSSNGNSNTNVNYHSSIVRGSQSTTEARRSLFRSLRGPVVGSQWGCGGEGPTPSSSPCSSTTNNNDDPNPSTTTRSLDSSSSPVSISTPNHEHQPLLSSRGLNDETNHSTGSNEQRIYNVNIIPICNLDCKHELASPCLLPNSPTPKQSSPRQSSKPLEFAQPDSNSTTTTTNQLRSLEPPSQSHPIQCCPSTSITSRHFHDLLMIGMPARSPAPFSFKEEDEGDEEQEAAALSSSPGPRALESNERLLGSGDRQQGKGGGGAMQQRRQEVSGRNFSLDSLRSRFDEARAPDRRAQLDLAANEQDEEPGQSTSGSPDSFGQLSSSNSSIELDCVDADLDGDERQMQSQLPLHRIQLQSDRDNNGGPSSTKSSTNNKISNSNDTNNSNDQCNYSTTSSQCSSSADSNKCSLERPAHRRRRPQRRRRCRSSGGSGAHTPQLNGQAPISSLGGQPRPPSARPKVNSTHGRFWSLVASDSSADSSSTGQPEAEAGAEPDQMDAPASHLARASREKLARERVARSPCPTATGTRPNLGHANRTLEPVGPADPNSESGRDTDTRTRPKPMTNDEQQSLKSRLTRDSIVVEMIPSPPNDACAPVASHDSRPRRPPASAQSSAGAPPLLASAVDAPRRPRAASSQRRACSRDRTNWLAKAAPSCSGDKYNGQLQLSGDDEPRPGDCEIRSQKQQPEINNKTSEHGETSIKYTSGSFSRELESRPCYVIEEPARANKHSKASATATSISDNDVTDDKPPHRPGQSKCSNSAGAADSNGNSEDDDYFYDDELVNTTPLSLAPICIQPNKAGARQALNANLAPQFTSSQLLAPGSQAQWHHYQQQSLEAAKQLLLLGYNCSPHTLLSGSTSVAPPTPANPRLVLPASLRRVSCPAGNAASVLSALATSSQVWRQLIQLGAQQQQQSDANLCSQCARHRQFGCQSASSSQSNSINCDPNQTPNVTTNGPNADQQQQTSQFADSSSASCCDRKSSQHSIGSYVSDYFSSFDQQTTNTMGSDNQAELWRELDTFQSLKRLHHYSNNANTSGSSARHPHAHVHQQQQHPLATNQLYANHHLINGRGCGCARVQHNPSQCPQFGNLRESSAAAMGGLPELRRQSTITGFDHRQYTAHRSPSLCLPPPCAARRQLNPAAAAPSSSARQQSPSQSGGLLSPTGHSTCGSNSSSSPSPTNWFNTQPNQQSAGSSANANQAPISSQAANQLAGANSSRPTNQFQQANRTTSSSHHQHPSCHHSFANYQHRASNANSSGRFTSGSQTRPSAQFARARLESLESDRSSSPSWSASTSSLRSSLGSVYSLLSTGAGPPSGSMPPASKCRAHPNSSVAPACCPLSPPPALLGGSLIKTTSKNQASGANLSQLLPSNLNARQEQVYFFLCCCQRGSASSAATADDFNENSNEAADANSAPEDSAARLNQPPATRSATQEQPTTSNVNLTPQAPRRVSLVARAPIVEFESLSAATNRRRSSHRRDSWGLAPSLNASAGPNAGATSAASNNNKPRPQQQPQATNEAPVKQELRAQVSRRLPFHCQIEHPFHLISI